MCHIDTSHTSSYRSSESKPETFRCDYGWVFVRESWCSTRGGTWSDQLSVGWNFTASFLIAMFFVPNMCPCNRLLFNICTTSHLYILLHKLISQSRPAISSIVKRLHNPPTSTIARTTLSLRCTSFIKRKASSDYVISLLLIHNTLSEIPVRRTYNQNK